MADAVRRLNDLGVEAFRDYLGKLRKGDPTPPPRWLLENPETSEPLAQESAVEPRMFPDRMEAARYLDNVLSSVTNVLDDVGLWSWLSLYYFDQVAPERPGRTRQPGRDYRHIPEPGYLRGHRHLLGGAVMVYRLHGENARLMLSTRPFVESHFHHQISARQAIVSNAAVVSAAGRLYLNAKTQRPKRGAQQATTPGNLLRFIAVVQQLDVNYDLYSMTADGILSLLPAEFDRWKPKQRRFSRRKKTT